MKRRLLIAISSISLTVIAVFALGLYSGWALASWKTTRYSDALTDYYIEGRRLKLEMARRSIVKAEDKRYEDLVDQHALLLRGTFLALVDLHKSGEYAQHEPDIRASLHHAAQFIRNRKQLFLKSLGTIKHTDHERKRFTNQLDTALEYVRRLPGSDEK